MPLGYIPAAGQWKVTGATRVRLGFRNKLVLQVEKSRPVGCANAGRISWDGSESTWVDAQIEDLQAIGSLVGPDLINNGLVGARKMAEDACRSLVDGAGKGGA